MKILIISQHYYPENWRINDISFELAKRGHNVTVLCGYPNYGKGEIYDGYNKKGKNTHKDEFVNGVHIIRSYEHPRKHSKIHLFLNYYTACFSMMYKARKMKEKYDVVFINQLAPVMQARAGLVYAKRHKVKTLLYCYDLWPDNLSAGGVKKGSWIYNLYYLVSNKIYKKVDKIAVTSKRFIPYFIKFHHINENNVSYLPLYCEDIFSKVKNSENDRMKKNKIYNYVFAGNIGKLQSVETILKAANIIKNDKSIMIHIIGDGSNYENCKKMADELKLNNVKYYGRKPMEEMPKYYEMADAMLVTLLDDDTINNTLPGKVQSYMLAKKPIIASANGETQDILKEARCGLYCNAEDYKGLAELLIKFRNENKEELSNNSYKYYMNNFRKDMFFEKLENKLEELK